MKEETLTFTAPWGDEFELTALDDEKMSKASAKIEAGGADVSKETIHANVFLAAITADMCCVRWKTKDGKVLEDYQRLKRFHQFAPLRGFVVSKARKMHEDELKQYGDDEKNS
ncbi:MAG: hypothetical protein ABIT01_19610 [Thermoanaerobaculia bacterium]